MNIGIYALVNQTDGRMYIGQSRNLEKRKTTHFWMLRENRHFNVHLQRAWNRGDRFDFKVLETCKTSDLNQKEKMWIKKLNTMQEGYNLCEGGDATEGYHFTKEQKEKISKANKGRKRSAEVSKRAQETLKKRMVEDKEFSKRLTTLRRQQALDRGFGGYNKGTHHTEEEKKNLSEKLKGRIVSEKHKSKLRELYSGEKSITAKLKESDVLEIRYRFLCGERQKDICKDYPNIAPQTIYDIVRFRRWKHLPNTIEELEEKRWKQGTSAQGR